MHYGCLHSGPANQRSVPVPGRSDLRPSIAFILFQRSCNTGRCCGRGRPHSANCHNRGCLQHNLIGVHPCPSVVNNLASPVNAGSSLNHRADTTCAGTLHVHFSSTAFNA